MTRWTEQMLDRFMVAEVVMDELATIAAEFPGFFNAAELNAIETLQRDAWEGFATEPLSARRARMERIRDTLQGQFPCKYRTLDERAEREKGAA